MCLYTNLQNEKVVLLLLADRISSSVLGRSCSSQCRTTPAAHPTVPQTETCSDSGGVAGNRFKFCRNSEIPGSCEEKQIGLVQITHKSLMLRTSVCSVLDFRSRTGTNMQFTKHLQNLSNKLRSFHNSRDETSRDHCTHTLKLCNDDCLT